MSFPTDKMCKIEKKKKRERARRGSHRGRWTERAPIRRGRRRCPASEGGAAVGGGKGHYRPAAMYAGEGASKVGSFFSKS